jgi:hypothetical protein
VACTKPLYESPRPELPIVNIVAVRPLLEILMEELTMFTIGNSGRGDSYRGFVQATKATNIKNKCFFNESG